MFLHGRMTAYRRQTCSRRKSTGKGLRNPRIKHLLLVLDQDPSYLDLTFHVTKMQSDFNRRTMFSNELLARNFYIKQEKAEWVCLKQVWGRGRGQCAKVPVSADLSHSGS